MALQPKHKKLLKAGALAALAFVAYLIYNWFRHRFTDNFHGQAMAEILNLPNPTRFGGNLGFTTKMKHGLNPGDAISITQDSGAKWPQYDGDTTVASILDDYNFTIDKGYEGSSPANPGSWKKI